MLACQVSKLGVSSCLLQCVLFIMYTVAWERQLYSVKLIHQYVLSIFEGGPFCCLNTIGSFMPAAYCTVQSHESVNMLCYTSLYTHHMVDVVKIKQSCSVDSA